MAKAHSGMPTMRMFQEQSNFVYAQLTRAYQIGGLPVIDAHLASGAGGWTQVPVIGFGGGRKRFIYGPAAGDQGEGSPVFAVGEDSDPTGADSAEVLLLFPGDSNFPVCLGSKAHHSIDLRDKTSTIDDDGAKNTDELGHQDVIARNGGAVWVIDENGAVVIGPGDTQDVHVKLLALASRLRIERDGKAVERVLLANRTLDYIGELEDKLDNQDSRIAALETSMATMVAFMQSGPAVLAHTTVTPYLGTFSEVSSVSRPTADGTLVASSVHISDDDEA